MVKCEPRSYQQYYNPLTPARNISLNVPHPAVMYDVFDNNMGHSTHIIIYDHDTTAVSTHRDTEQIVVAVIVNVHLKLALSAGVILTLFRQSINRVQVARQDAINHSITPLLSHHITSVPVTPMQAIRPLS